MIRTLIRKFRTLTTPSPKANPIVESLEDRRLMAAPRIASVFADNRGQVILHTDIALQADTVTTRSAQIFTIGADGRFGTADDKLRKTRVRYFASTRDIVMITTLRADTAYRVFLNASKIKGTNGQSLDGEFNGMDKITGNGKAGGNFNINTRIPTTDRIARMVTVAGLIDVRLFGSTPITTANFIKYANDGDWDNTIFHRSVPGFVIQGGGYTVSSTGIGTVPEDSAILNEPILPSPRNVRGTIAMARQDDRNPNTTDDIDSATNQFFFNVADNSRKLDNLNGGFTTFGKILGRKGLAVMDRINRLQRSDIRGSTTIPIAIRGAFGEVPVLNGDFVFIDRVSLKMNLVAVRR